MADRPSRAPDRSLTSVVSGRTIRLAEPGATVVLIFTNQATAERATALRLALRERFPDPATVVIASVVDMRGVPRLLRKVAEGMLANRYHELAAALGPGKDPAQYLVMCPDWEGELAKALGVGDTASEVGLAVIDPSGAVVGTYAGPEPLAAAVALLEGVGP